MRRAVAKLPGLLPTQKTCAGLSYKRVYNPQPGSGAADRGAANPASLSAAPQYTTISL